VGKDNSISVNMECRPYSVGHAQEGVCLLVKIGPYRVLLDCGLTDMTNLLADFNDLSIVAVFCSHAHADHARGLLTLHEYFPQIPIYASKATSQLLPVNWPTEQTPADFCQSLAWQEILEIANGLTAQIFPVGHLPGAAGILLTYQGQNSRTYKLFYTGDFFLSHSRLVEGFPLASLRGMKPDVLIIEGSYGTARYPHRRQLENLLAERIERAIASGTSVILPTPVLGLGQELLMLLRSHHFFTGKDIDIWVDGQVSNGCDLYLELLNDFPVAVQNFAQHQPLFWDERIKPRVRKLINSEDLINYPCIIITDLNSDFSQYWQHSSNHQTQSDRPDHWLILLSDNNEDLGATTIPHLDPALLASVEIETYTLVDHSDGPGTTQLIHNLRPQHIIFIHGTPLYLEDLTNLEELRNRYQIHLPAAGTVVELPIGEMFLQPALPDNHYEGELTELGGEVTINLPHHITNDRHWLNFADTGLIEARWQGEELVLRGVSQREFLLYSSKGKGTSNFIDSSIDACANCLYYRGQRCWHQSSPLFGFKVTPDGYCPVFISVHEEAENME